MNFIILNSGALPIALLGVLVAEPGRSPALCLTVTWSDVILDPAVTDLFFAVYWKVRSNPQLAHHSRACLVQLSSLNGEIIQSPNVKLQYLITYMTNFLRLISNTEIIDQEAISIANIFTGISTFFGTALPSLPDDMKKSFLEQMTLLTCLFAESASQEESVSKTNFIFVIIALRLE